jgi:hypothetical protein
MMSCIPNKQKSQGKFALAFLHTPLTAVAFFGMILIEIIY